MSKNSTFPGIDRKDFAHDSLRQSLRIIGAIDKGRGLVGSTSYIGDVRRTMAQSTCHCVRVMDTITAFQLGTGLTY